MPGRGGRRHPRGAQGGRAGHQVHASDGAARPGGSPVGYTAVLRGRAPTLRMDTGLSRTAMSRTSCHSIGTPHSERIVCGAVPGQFTTGITSMRSIRPSFTTRRAQARAAQKLPVPVVALVSALALTATACRSPATPRRAATPRPPRPPARTAYQRRDPDPGPHQGQAQRTRDRRRRVEERPGRTGARDELGRRGLRQPDHRGPTCRPGPCGTLQEPDQKGRRQRPLQ